MIIELAITLLTSSALAQTQDQISNAFIYALPAGEYLKTKMRLYYKYPNSYNGFAVNQPLVPDETFTAVVAPNVDTVYAVGVFDLAASPRLVTVPPITDGRYVVNDFVDPYGNVPFSFNSIKNPQGGNYLIYGPSTSDNDAVTMGSQNNATPIKFNTSDAMVLLRARHNATDAQQAANFLASYKAVRLNPSADIPLGQKFNETVAQMASFGLQLTDIGVLASQYSNSIQNATIGWKWALMGLKYVEPSTPSSAAYVQTFQSVIDQATMNVDFMKKIAAQVPSIINTINSGTSQIGTQYKTGWAATNNPVVGNFGENYLARAAVAYVLYLGLPPSQAVYYQTTIDPVSGQPYNGGNTYQLTFSKSQLPPVDGFWSITAYYGTGDNSYGYLIGNPIQRYAIGDRTPGLVYNSDGSLTLTLSPNKPSDATQAANWLPIGAGRTFELFLRAYAPKDSISQFTPPQLLTATGKITTSGNLSRNIGWLYIIVLALALQ
ncbi:hypothetical protein HDV06_006371 [Boothiomyces sp. JEL0866]|nr:hypothetical protein HDV06_006371 [Boothiomyces sp. JEL0866]